MFASALRVAMSREAAPAGYITTGVKFDQDRLESNGTLTGPNMSDGKLLTCSFWFRRPASGTSGRFYHNQGTRLQIRWDSDRIRVNTNGTQINALTSAITDTASWHHYIISFDLTDTGKRHIYVDNVSDATWSLYADSNINFNRTNHAVGSQEGTDLNNLKENLADFWFAPNQYIDLSVAANRLLFRSAAGKPLFLGEDGGVPTGTGSAIFFQGDATIWNAGTNKGTAQNFTMEGGSGAVTDSITSPSD